MSDGWVCPKCGSVYAPIIVECWRCNAPKDETIMQLEAKLAELERSVAMRDVLIEKLDQSWRDEVVNKPPGERECCQGCSLPHELSRAHKDRQLAEERLVDADLKLAAWEPIVRQAGVIFRTDDGDEWCTQGDILGRLFEKLPREFWPPGVEQ